MPRTRARTRERNRGRIETRLLDCLETTPSQAGFPGARTIARLRCRVVRNGKTTDETVYLISSLTLDELNAAGFLSLKRGYWIIESRLHHALDITLGEDRSRVHQRNAALVLSLFRRVVVSFAQAWVDQCRKLNKRSRATTGRFQKRFHRNDGGSKCLEALIFARSPDSWCSTK